MVGRKRKPGGGRKPSKPDYNPSAILQNQMNAAVALYSTDAPSSLQTIADELDLNPIKVRKLLITAGVYKSDATDQVQRVFNKHRDSGLSHTEAIAATMKELNLSKASVIFGENVKIYDHNHQFVDAKTRLKDQGYATSAVTIGNRCWFGSNVIVLKGVNIGNNCVIGAGSIINQDIPDDSIVMSNRDLDIKKIIRKEVE